jgi:hypothetical protein
VCGLCHLEITRLRQHPLTAIGIRHLLCCLVPTWLMAG